MFGFEKKKKRIEQGIESKELEIMEFMVHYIPDHCTCSHAPFYRTDKIQHNTLRHSMTKSHCVLHRISS